MKHPQLIVAGRERRQRGRWAMAWLVVVLLASAVTAGAESTSGMRSDTWFFSMVEIGAAYQYQENYGVRIRNPLPAQSCLYGKSEFSTSYRFARVQVPCQFVNEISRHLKDMLDMGAARYLFPLDADHAHLAVPNELWEQKYKKLPAAQLMAALLQEPKLVALYHTAEHLDPSVLFQEDDGTKSWMEKRNVLGFFDGRPTQVLPPDPRGYGVGLPDGLMGYGGFHFLANHRGALILFARQKAVAFDVSLDIEDMDPGFAGPALLRAVRRR